MIKVYPKQQLIYENDTTAKYYKRQPPQKSVCLNLGRSIVKAAREFCLETSIHGLNHIAVPRRLWIERFLWLGVVSAAIWGAVDISLGQWQRYNESPTVVTVEKDFRSWTFAFPATTVCSGNKTNPAKVQQAIRTLWNVEPGDDRYSYYQDFVETVANSDLFHMGNYQKYADDQTLDVDLYQLAVDVMPELDVKVTWSNGVTSKWIPVMTESGICYVTNSLAAADIAIRKLEVNETKDLPYTCRYADDCYVIFEISARTDFNIHSPFDVADILTYPSSVFPSLKRRVTVSVLETRCGAGVGELTVRRRGCLYLHEGAGGTKQVYSSNMCRRTCRNSIAMSLCGCKPLYYFYEAGPLCTPAGMACLAKHLHKFVNPKCACMVQCVDALFKEISQENTYWRKGPFAIRGDIRYTVQAPRTRYTREIVFHFQDLVVSFGGAAGFFLGASFLSFVEIFYFILERSLMPCFQKPPDKRNKVNPKNHSRISYETAQIMHLTSILDNLENVRGTKRLNYF